MAMKRSHRDLSIYVGQHRNFEWYWASNGSMPGRDAFEALPSRDQDDFLASIIHWASVPRGGRPLQTRINNENDDPLIIAIKAGKHRFAAFREEDGSTWIVSHHYLKKGQQRDKTGDRAIVKAIKARADYWRRVSEGTYYERD